MKGILSICTVVLTAAAAFAGLTVTNPWPSVTLGWNQSPDTNVVSYQVYWGTAPRNYTNVVSVSGLGTTQVTIGSQTNGVLRFGTSYYFAATCVSASGLESDFSSEVSWNTPAVPLPPTELRTNVLVVEASPDLKGWSDLADLALTTSGPKGYFRLRIVGQ